MKNKFLKTICCGGLVAASLLPVGIGKAQDAAYEQVLENKVYIVGSIGNKREVTGTMESLELAGMTGAFVVSPEELRQYPETVKLITMRGHKLIVQMAKATAVPTKASTDLPKTRIANQPNTVETMPVKEGPLAAARKNKAENKDASVKASAKTSKPENVVEKVQSDNVKIIEARPAETGTRQSLAKRMANENSGQAKAKKPIVNTNNTANNVNRPEAKGPAQVAMKAVGHNIEEKVVSAKPLASKNNRKEVVARDFFGTDETGNRLQAHYPATAKDKKDVPDWVLGSFIKLSDDDLFAPDSIMNIQSEPDREFLAKFIIRALQNNENKKPPHYAKNKQELDKLVQEFDTELCNLGYKAEPYAKIQPKAYDTRTKIRGEIRQHYVDNDGDKDFKRYDHRTRLRIYVEQPVAKDWAIVGMGEADKSWPHDNPHGNVELERLYVSGKIVDTSLRAGRFGELYADGNVYDGRIDGISVDTGKKVKLHAAVGELRSKEKGGAISASYSDKRYDVEAGIYSFDKVKNIGRDTIISGAGNYYIGNFSVGGMILGASGEGVDGGQVGIVGSVRYGRNRSWVPGTFEIFAKYYNQPESTYIGHTMVGLADRMHGFKGYGLGLYYTLAPNTVYGLEYYDLKERATGKIGRTLWNHVSYYF